MDILITKRLTLRSPLEVDIDRIVEAFQNENVTRMLTGAPHPYKMQDAETWLRDRATETGTSNFAIYRQNLLGVIGVENKDDGPNLGYWLDEPYWGQGYMSEAAHVVLAHVFRKQGYDWINSGAYDDNPGSRRVLEKLGFQQLDVTSHFNPTRGCEVRCNTVKLTRADFERRFGPLETAEAA